MKPDSRTIIHIGINYILTPFPPITPQLSLAYQQSVLRNGLTYTRATNQPNGFFLEQDDPLPLNITLATLNPPQIGQFRVIATHPNRPIGVFVKEAEAALQAFLDIYKAKVFQIISCDIALRELHETSSDHAFKELWEKKLGQSTDSLMVFGKPMQGGGLRFVMPPQENEKYPAQIDLRIESYLENTNKLFIETQLGYPQSITVDPNDISSFGIQERLSDVNQFVEERVCAFINGEPQK